MVFTDSKITKELLHQLFRYEDGKLFWIKSPNNQRINVEAGWNTKLGYRHVYVKGKTYRSYHIIYMMFHGHLPRLIDHIDGNPSNNKIENLREASTMQNCWNQKNRVTNTSGIKGISWSDRYQAWMARCMVNYKSHFLGRHKNLEDAVKVLKEFRTKAHGEFARHN
jgi:hypothetical protein